MKRVFAPVILLLSLAVFARAEVTPLDAPLEDGSTTEITVKYDGAPVKVGKYTFKPPAGEYHYNLFLPPDYNKDPKEIFPLLFIQSPGGGSAMGKMKPRMTKDRFVVVGLVEARNGPWEPIIADFCASHDDVIKRVRIAEGFKFMTGFSGGGRSSTFMSDLRPGFIGCFPQGAGVWPAYAETPHNPNVAMFISMGGNDSNIKELPALHQLLPPKKAFTMVFHEGGHGNAPQDVVEQGWDWLEWWAYFGSPTQSAAKPMYTQYFNKLADDAETADGEFAKYELLESADKIASGRSLTNNKDVAAKLLKVKKSMADLAKSDLVKKELPARAAYQKVVDNEYSARRQAKGDFTVHRHFMGEVSKLYDGVAKKFPGTVYGEKAAAAATRTKAEADLPNSTKEKGGQSD
ncbi:hypothetical protein BH10PLA1_BH10PLA1_18380 [soil metagenome]